MRSLDSNINGVFELYVFVIYFVLNFKNDHSGCYAQNRLEKRNQGISEESTVSAGKDVEKLNTQTL